MVLGDIDETGSQEDLAGMMPSLKQAVRAAGIRGDCAEGGQEGGLRFTSVVAHLGASLRCDVAVLRVAVRLTLKPECCSVVARRQAGVV